MNGTKKILDKICFVSIDVEGEEGETNFKGVVSLDKILDIFKKYNIPATLFVTGNVLERFSENLKDWGSHFEIASHSFSHRFWNDLTLKERKEEIEKFIRLYQEIFQQNPKGFRAPSHIIDEKGLKLLEEKCFLYDSSILPHYPFLKKYRGYKGKFPLLPYWYSAEILEIPVAGLIFGIPLAGTWISKLPLFFYKFLFLISQPAFLTLNFHSWTV